MIPALSDFEDDGEKKCGSAREKKKVDEVWVDVATISFRWGSMQIAKEQQRKIQRKGGEEEERWRERVETSYNIASEMVMVVAEGSMGYSIFISVERQSSSEAGGRGGSFLDKKEW